MEPKNTDVNDLIDLFGSTLQIKDDKPLTIDELKTENINQEVNTDDSILIIQKWYRNICNKSKIKCKLINYFYVLFMRVFILHNIFHLRKKLTTHHSTSIEYNST